MVENSYSALIERIESSSHHDGVLFADSKNISGEFFLEGLDITVNLTDEQLDEIEKSDELKKQYMQAYHHEFAHLYQVLALPAFRLLWAARHNYMRMQAFVMLRYFELGKSFDLKENTKILDVLKNPEFLIEEGNGMKFGSILENYDIHVSNWKNTDLGISLFDIIEGMAHIVSLQLSDTPEEDVLEIEQFSKYSSAYAYFNSKIDSDNFEIRWKYLLFLYVCYFACQHVNGNKKTDQDAAVKMFKFLCSQSQDYLNTLKKLHTRYDRYSEQELQSLNRWTLLESDFKGAKHQKRASIYSLFELIEIIEEEAKTKGLNESLQTEALDDFFIASKNLGVDFYDIFTLARMVIFPSNFYWLPEIHKSVMNSSSGDKSFTYKDETEFYYFIHRCNLLFDQSANVLCCDEHGAIDKRKKILRCNVEGGLAFTLQKLTTRPAFELFLS